MANNEWIEEAVAAARAEQRRETGGASVPAGGVQDPAEASIPGAPEHEGRTLGSEVGTGPAAPPRPEVASGRRGDEPDLSPPRGSSAEEGSELHGEPPDQPVLYGEDPGDIGQ